jgi:DNA-binding transcriptional regulator YhcF (GntR family)
MAQSSEVRGSVQTTPFWADPQDELPVGVQLAWRLRALIAARRLGPGDRLPSVRALAGWAGVNVNTVRGVYARLEEEGLIDTRHGSGTFVASSASGSPAVERIAADAIDASRDADVDPRDVAIVALVSAAIPDALSEGLPPEPPELDDDAIERAELGIDELAEELELDDSWLEVDEKSARRELRRQIGRVEAELASYRRDIEPPEGSGRPREPRIVGVGGLERTRDDLLAQLAAARAAAVRRARRERRARAVRDEMVADPAAHRWEVVSAAEAGEEGCLEWRVSPRLGPLGALASWWRVKVSGGCPLAAPLAAAGAGDGERIDGPGSR